ncbi:histidine kinase [Halomarina litorea]|uniref:histidine kinase n=1 Tax=Halomarina litorea TaxID=2961595 RepID=UPI0020C31C15|nr:histidine kinase [Halomarina sp. BCD28]
MSYRGEAPAETAAPGEFDVAWAWKGGAVAGLAATVVMGAVITVVDLPTLRGAIAGLYGFEGSLVAGWLAHLVHGTLFGVLFAWLLSDPGLYRVHEWVWKSVLAGVVYAVVLAVVGAGIVMPIWLDAVGVAAQPGIPNVTTASLVWHIVYGVVLGALFPFVDDL